MNSDTEVMSGRKGTVPVYVVGENTGLSVIGFQAGIDGATISEMKDRKGKSISHPWIGKAIDPYMTIYFGMVIKSITLSAGKGQGINE